MIKVVDRRRQSEHQQVGAEVRDQRQLLIRAVIVLAQVPHEHHGQNEAHRVLERVADDQECRFVGQGAHGSGRIARRTRKRPTLIGSRREFRCGTFRAGRGALASVGPIVLGPREISINAPHPSVMRAVRSRLLQALALAILVATGVSRGDERPARAAAPLVLYTDLVSGPNSGGENDKGAYLSIFGKHFGHSGLGTRTRVYIGGTEVAVYRYLGPSHGSPDIEQISVQIGKLGAPPLGVPLPIVVKVDGIPSNADSTFIVNPGRIL